MKISQKPYNKKLTYSYAIGVYPTLELLRYHPYAITKIVISSKGTENEGVEKIKNFCQSKKIPLETNNDLVLKLSGIENCYAIGVFTKYSSQLDPQANHVLLADPSDMGNLGTIIRTMVGFNCLNLAIIRPGLDIFHPKVIRASMGSVFQINFSYYNNFNEYKKYFDHSYYPFMLQATRDLEEVIFQNPCTLIFGNEGAGLGEEYMQIGEPVKISQSESVDSLNLAVATGLALYKLHRQHT